MDPSPNRFYDALVAARGRPFVIAHRGDSAHSPENTLDAAHLAWRKGADAWELDVHLTRDGVTVVLHDKSLLRTTDVAARFDGDPRVADGAYVADFDLDEVRTLDAGTWFLSETVLHRTAVGFGTQSRITPDDHARFSSGDVRIPTLREALELTARLDWLVNVEIKSFPTSDPLLLDAVIADLDASRTADRVLISRGYSRRCRSRGRSDTCESSSGLIATTRRPRSSALIPTPTAAGRTPKPSATAISTT
jgi:glycerophosphoryl diester phosphodiesterase